MHVDYLHFKPPWSFKCTFDWNKLAKVNNTLLLPGSLWGLCIARILHMITSENRLYSICNLLSPVVSHSRGRIKASSRSTIYIFYYYLHKVSSVYGVLTIRQCSLFYVCMFCMIMVSSF